MSIYVISAVRRDSMSDEVSHVRWAQVDAQGGGLIGAVVEADAIDVVDEIQAGNEVFTWHTVGGTEIRGRAVRVEALGNGNEVLRTDEADQRHTLGLEDLPKF
ncbi:hypothetical protein IB268_26345 [Achromobacter sp. ACM01]|uniref:hypothetical protein n=1 Tax=Achromobacter sp. ACM01 TaxID=2769298 RepID=UPI00178527C1|nr:hypothetical protein [Achromobacter sp. ACM01]MBD9476459.1 hypothetical protein [Achromobacter sp. ACM01]